MPVIRSAIKKMRKDKVRTERNRRRGSTVTKLLKTARKNPSLDNTSALFSALDKAVKIHLIHKNTAARLKSRLTKKTTKK